MVAHWAKRGRLRADDAPHELELSETSGQLELQ